MTHGSIICHLDNGNRFVSSPTTNPNVMLYTMEKKVEAKAGEHPWSEVQRWVLAPNKGPVNNNLDLEQKFVDEGEGFVQTKSGPIIFFYDEETKSVWMNGPGLKKPLKVEMCETFDNKILLNAKMSEAIQVKLQKSDVPSIPNDTDAITGTGEQPVPANHKNSK